MSWYEDFRISVQPATAKQRLEYFRGQRSFFDAHRTLAQMKGQTQPKYDEISLRYEDLLRAHIAFAQAQLSALETPREDGQP